MFSVSGRFSVIVAIGPSSRTAASRSSPVLLRLSKCRGAAQPVGPKRSVRIRCGVEARPRAAARRPPRRTRSSRRRRRCPTRRPASAISAASMRPVWPVQPAGGLAREGEQRVVAELVGVDHLVGGAHRVDEPHRQVGHRAAPVAQHRHQRHHSRPAADEQHRLPRRATRSRRRTARAPRPGRPRRPRRGSRGRPRRRRAGRSSARSRPRRAGRRRSSRSAARGSRRAR